MATKDYDKAVPKDLDLTQTPGYVPGDKDAKVVKYMERMFDASKRARAHKVPRWRRNEELHNGDFLSHLNCLNIKQG